jgi:phosphatidylserine/phosphatidylglycerophosphate/cardiolipin synthase-like enzyme
LFGPPTDFDGSEYPEVGLSGLFPVRPPDECSAAVLAGGEDSFAVRMARLKNADTSIRLQALIFRGDESGLRIAEVLKEKKAAGLDVRVIVDAFSNPELQSQWMYFDLKQHGIEVEGYEALYMQWINELPVPFLRPHVDLGDPDRRYHEKLWIIDGETDHAIAVTGGLNMGNEYFRADPIDPGANWRDQDVVVRGAVVKDMVATFDRNFDHFVEIKKSKGIFDTNIYWDATRAVLDVTGKLPVVYSTKPEFVERVAALEARQPALEFRPATCRFMQNRPRLKETYIQQAYLKLIEGAKHEILIANAYFVPTPSIAAALKDAASRCVAVTVISNSPEVNDLPEISMVGRSHYKDLLAVNGTPQVAACKNKTAGIQVWEWVGQRTDEETRSQGTMHSKFAVVDRRQSLVGSYNLDPRSQKLNSESGIVFEQEELSGQLARAILEHDLKYSRRVTPERAAEFGDSKDVIYQFREKIGRFFEEEF